MKLGMGFGLLLVIIAVMGFMSYTSINKLSDLSDEVNKQAHKTQLATQADGTVELQTSVTRGYVLSGSEASLKRRTDGMADYDKIMGELNKLLQTEAGKAAWNRADGAAKELRDIQSRAIELRRGGKTKEATDELFAEHASQVRTEAQDSLDDLVTMIDRLEKAAQEQHEQIETSTVRKVVTLAIAGMLIGIGVAVFIVRSITGAVARMVAMIQEIANNNLTISDMTITSQDEIGHAGAALNRMKNNLNRMIMEITENALQVGTASEELSSTSQQITANFQETSAQAEMVSKAAQTVSQNLQTVATGSEEMGASIKEIAKNATEAAKIATAAVRVAETTTTTVSKLGDSSTEIGQVIKVITSIAQQTNLLALNATIEAARAGEAGKGFAVVANEVKELAKETAKATEDISRKIEAIQTDTKAAVEAIASISGVISQINDISGTIATAVEEQNATTNEMSRNVSEAAHGSGEITSNIAGVAEAAESTTRGAGDTQKAAQLLVETSNRLRQLVEQFKVNAGGSSASTNSVRSMKAAAGQ
jgi:methyl-accepting chemotaxis protein